MMGRRAPPLGKESEVAPATAGSASAHLRICALSRLGSNMRKCLTSTEQYRLSRHLTLSDTNVTIPLVLGIASYLEMI